MASLPTLPGPLALQVTYIPEETLLRFSAKLFNCTPAMLPPDLKVGTPAAPAPLPATACMAAPPGGQGQELACLSGSCCSCCRAASGGGDGS